MSAADASDFFNALGSQQNTTVPSNKSTPQRENEKDPRSASSDQVSSFDPKTAVTEAVSKNGDWNKGQESMIKNNLMLGNLQYAAEVALKSGRTTEALLIAE